MKRNLLFPMLLVQALSYQAYSVEKPLAFIGNTVDKVADVADEKIATLNDKLQALCGNDKKVDLENVEKESNRIWKEIVNQLNNARIKTKMSGDYKLNNRSTVGLRKDTISETSIGSNYSGIDNWELSLSAIFPLKSAIDLGVTGIRKFTFIQQFPNRCKSLVRIGYDPVTKLPIDSERAIKRLNPGDFVAFSAPLVVSLGKNISRFSDSALTGAAIGASVFAAGEINIQVFKMNNNFVRVRFFAAKSKGIQGSVGIKFIGLNSIASRVFDLTPAELSMSKSTGNLFSADYIFNLNNEESRKSYDDIMGRKFELRDFPFLGLNPLAKDDSMKNALFADLEKIDQTAIDDSKKSLNNRRIIRLGRGDNKTTSFLQSFKFDLKVIQAEKSSNYSDSEITQFNVNNENKNYYIRSITQQSNGKLFEILGQENSYNTAFLFEADEKYVPTVSKGLQSVRTREELELTKREIIGLKNRLKKALPSEISDIINLPDTEKLAGSIANGRIEQTLFFDTQVLENLRSITKERIQEELIAIIKGWGHLDAELVDIKNISTDDPRIKDKEDGDSAYRYGKDGSEKYLAAFAKELELGNWRQQGIPTFLAAMFNPDIKPISNRLGYYSALQNIPLFNELGAALVLRLIPKDLLPVTVTYKLVVTGRGIEAKTSLYPVNADQSSSNIYNRVLNENALLTDRSYNLRYYMNEQGQPMSLEEVVKRSE